MTTYELCVHAHAHTHTLLSLFICSSYLFGREMERKGEMVNLYRELGSKKPEPSAKQCVNNTSFCVITQDREARK